jgi:predicted glycoside hydrolase/deacetylase ChbG (UPF0249 family)
MRLIVNADDFGITKGVSLGILDAMEKGIVTETTAMTNGWYFEEGMKEAAKRGIKNIGIHLTFTWGKPVLPVEQVQSLVDENGYFQKLSKAKDIEFNYDEVRAEVKAQMERFISFGLMPTHIDGHHHFFAYDHKILDIVLDVAKEYDLPVRCPDGRSRELYKLKGIRTTDAFAMDFYQENVTEDKLKEIINRYKDSDIVELMCHPAYVDEDLIKATTYNTWRKAEFELLISENIKNFIKENNIELIGFDKI